MNLRRFIPTSCTERDRANIDLAADEVYRILGNRRRRLLLVALDNHADEQVSLGELARDVAAQDEPTIGDDAPREAYDATYVALYQSHVPVLDEHDVVEWDSDRNVLRPRPSVSALVDVVRELDERTQ